MKTLARGFLVLWLVPTAALARLGDGDASFQAWMRPSPHYASMVIPCFVAAVAISSLMLMRCLHLGRPLSGWRIAALLLNTILTGLVLFVLFILLFILPRAARICYKVGLHEQNPDIP
jgi:hypothetical protein